MRNVVIAGLIGLFGSAPVWAADPFLGNLGGSFELTDQFGELRTEKSPDGKAQLVFFGYANCPDICTAALPLMAEIVSTLEKDDVDVTPIMITVDPNVDTPETMGPPMAKWHPDFVGLSGSPEALQVSYDAFQVEITPLFQEPTGQWIFAHGSFIYLLNEAGELLTLVPPILGPDEAANIVKKYLQPS